jgi:ankyrin repeat protein
LLALGSAPGAAIELRSSVDDIFELFQLVGLGDAAAVREMLRFRPELARARDASSLSVMQFARYMGEDAIMEMVIEAGPPLDVFDAGALDRTDRLRELLAADPSPARAHGADGLTALHAAAAFDAARAISLLLAAGAPIEARTRDTSSMTPLHLAAAKGRLAACRLLLRHGADPNATAAGGVTPLMLAAETNLRDLAEILIARNSHVEARDAAGRAAAAAAAAAGHAELAARLRLGERVVDRRKA